MKLIKKDGIWYIQSGEKIIKRVSPHPMENIIDYAQRAQIELNKFLVKYN